MKVQRPSTIKKMIEFKRDKRNKKDKVSMIQLADELWVPILMFRLAVHHFRTIPCFNITNKALIATLLLAHGGQVNLYKL